MAKVGQMIESNYLKQADVEGDVIVTVAKVGQKNIAKEGDTPEIKWLVRFTDLYSRLCPRIA